MRVIHIGRAALSVFEPPEPCIIISVVDPTAPIAVFEPNPRIVDVLRVQPFHDIDEPYPGAVLFDQERAESIARFVLRHPEISLIVAQCEAGISRSAGIAAAIFEAFGLIGRSPFETGIPNRHVYRMLLEQLMRHKEKAA